MVTIATHQLLQTRVKSSIVIWKILVKMGIFPKLGGETRKYVKPPPSFPFRCFCNKESTQTSIFYNLCWKSRNLQLWIAGNMYGLCMDYVWIMYGYVWRYVWICMDMQDMYGYVICMDMQDMYVVWRTSFCMVYMRIPVSSLTNQTES